MPLPQRTILHAPYKFLLLLTVLCLVPQVHTADNNANRSPNDAALSTDAEVLEATRPLALGREAKAQSADSKHAREYEDFKRRNGLRLGPSEEDAETMAAIKKVTWASLNPARITRLAESGDAESQYQLALFEFFELTSKKTTAGGKEKASQQEAERALRWMKKAANQGHGPAASGLGELYGLGLVDAGLPKDLRQAVFWLQKAVDAGDAQGELLLAVLYWNGDGVDKNQRLAMDLITAAANKGSARAQWMLGRAYSTGDFLLKRDDVQAYKWLELAARKNFKKARWRRGEIAPMMTKDEITRAKKLADEFVVMTENPKKP